ncbi:MAG: hypothetical protein BGP24_10405 [Lysobacterales bacterium 69-70]|nr:FkbM family methyltransferase [Xanthomonadaceae bacterium]ODU33346.1 MAG: hypothetical protein ABS97_13425 [Xanthomonadaceae bacterium SCN 69-320]ODV18019.1 MAG: hypothetical protein ABT27_15395 [Xanthomonadaceae bacterium SCN 69-25]OJZ00889.1 MAG: hypothetical protein BGP24_10405 [Xanthomonadales bacterium 69-70]
MNVVAEYRISFLDYVARLARSRGVRRLAAQRRRRQAPRIACFADDDIGAQILAHGWYEDLLLQALFERFLRDRAAAFRAGVAVDVGANIGNHTLWFARRFARVVAVEPNPVCTHLLQASLLMNGVDNVHLLALGLSDTAGERPFHADLHGNLGRSGLAAELAASATRSFPVRVERGDTVLDATALAGLPLRLVKLDIEGHELAALRGMAGLLRTQQPVVLFEANRADGEDGGNAVLAELAQHGYRHFYAIETNALPGAGRLRRLLHRVREGLRLRLREVTQLPPRRHSLVLATVQPCAS